MQDKSKDDDHIILFHIYKCFTDIIFKNNEYQLEVYAIQVVKYMK